MNEPIPLTPGADEGIKDTAINQNFRDMHDRLIINQIKDNNGIVRMEVGKIPFNGDFIFGTVYYSSTGTPEMIHGIFPGEESPLLVIAKPGENVFDNI